MELNTMQEFDSDIIPGIHADASNNTNHNQHLIILVWSLGIPNLSFFLPRLKN